jgi:predicted ATPase
MLADLQASGFIHEQPAIAGVEYVFKHALTQEVAYRSLLNERRRLLHDRVGQAVEAMYAGNLDDHLDDLAYHFTHGANADKAVRYLTLAGKQSQERSAFIASEAQLRRGLDLTKTLSESQERDTHELELASTLARVLFITRGYTASETVAAAEYLPKLAGKETFRRGRPKNAHRCGTRNRRCIRKKAGRPNVDMTRKLKKNRWRERATTLFVVASHTLQSQNVVYESDFRLRRSGNRLPGPAYRVPRCSRSV